MSLTRLSPFMTHNNNKVASGLLLDGRYKLLRPLSSDGGTADVWLALDNNTIDEVFDDDLDEITGSEDSGIKVAIKIYRPKNALDLGEQRFREEFKIVFNCHHTNLVQPINFSISDGIPYLVLPFCQNGSSEKLQGKFHDKHELWKYISDVSSGLSYLHAFNPTIVHHDIKPANILIDDNRNYAITDFGISSHRGLNRDGYDESQSGTMAYMAPERFLNNYESTPESDIWSFGATLYELITGKVPFGEDGGAAQLENKLSPPVITQDIPSDIKKLVYDCLNIDPTRRPTAKYIYKAAQIEQYPIKSFRKYIIAALFFVVIIVGCFLMFNKPQEKSVTVTPEQPLSNEEVFDSAMNLVHEDNPDSLRKGLSILDSLCSLGYVPALYEEAYTYGWYPDSASLTRKDLLDIEYYTDGESKWMPKSYQINSKAISFLSVIDEKNDSAYPDINAQALYRLGVYYCNENKTFSNPDPDKAESLLIRALEWAKIANDESLIQKISKNLTFIQENKN